MNVKYLGRGENPTPVTGLGRIGLAENQRALVFLVDAADDAEADKIGRSIEQMGSKKK